MDPLLDPLPPTDGTTMPGIPGAPPEPEPGMAPPAGMPPLSPTGDMISREAPEPDPGRAALVQQLTSNVKAAKGKWGSVFKRMRQDMNFAMGKQWPGAPVTTSDNEDERYVANIVQRHVQQRTAVLYAKNPKAVAKRKDRIDYTVWDGTNAQFQQAQMGMQQAVMMGQPPDPIFGMIVEDHAKVMGRRALVDRIGKTLEIIYQYYIDEQVHTFKAEMKRAVRRVITCGVAYVKLGYQRIMQKTPDIQRQMADFQMQLANLQTMSARIADGEVDPNTADAERLKLALQALAQQPEVLVREGLTFDFPAATALIPDTKCRNLHTFAGSDWVAEEFLMSPGEVEAVYQRDVKPGYNAYTDQLEDSPSYQWTTNASHSVDEKGAKRDVLVWLIYHIKDGLVYTVADGYADFLEEPTAPNPLLERFWPWFPLMFNELEHEAEIFPPSDVRLLRHQQEEYNRSREGLREHRRANRPMTVAANGSLDDEDKTKLQNRPANALVELNGLQPGQDVKTVLQAWQGPPLDPAMYDTTPVFQDVLRVVGTQEANLGGTSNATATESSIAEGSRMSGLESNVDDLDDLLTELARAAGQVLLGELAPQTAKEIAGEGAAWPQLKRKEIADELMLSVEAGSSGRPNKAQDIANLERIMPFLLQMPGINGEWLAREVVKRMDDRIDPSDAVQSGAMSAMAMNTAAKGGQPGVGGGGAPPDAPPSGQAGGADNAQKPMGAEAQPARVGRPPMTPVNPAVAIGNA
jgi:hypothetical protein